MPDSSSLLVRWSRYLTPGPVTQRLHVSSMCASLLASYWESCRRSEGESGIRGEPRVPDGPGALDTKHFPSREESGAQEQTLSLSSPYLSCYSLSHTHFCMRSSLSVSPSPLPHIHSRPRARTLCVRLQITALISTASADLSLVFALSSTNRLGETIQREVSTNTFYLLRL